MAVLEEGKLVSCRLRVFHTPADRQYLPGKGGKYPGMQAAFIDIGMEKNAFCILMTSKPTGAEKEKERSTRRVSELVREGRNHRPNG